MNTAPRRCRTKILLFFAENAPSIDWKEAGSCVDAEAMQL